MLPILPYALMDIFFILANKQGHFIVRTCLFLTLQCSSLTSRIGKQVKIKFGRVNSRLNFSSSTLNLSQSHIILMA